MTAMCLELYLFTYLAFYFGEFAIENLREMSCLQSAFAVRHWRISPMHQMHIRVRLGTKNKGNNSRDPFAGKLNSAILSREGRKRKEFRLNDF